MTEKWASFVVLDDRKDQAQRIEAYLKAIFTEISLEIDVKVITAGAELKVCLERHPDFVITDVSLTGAYANSTGLELIQNHKPKHPHITFIAITQQIEKLTGLGNLIVQPDLVLSKHKILSRRDKKFDAYLRGYFITKQRQNRRLSISVTTNVEGITKKAFGWQTFDRPLFECLVRQVFKVYDVQLDPSQFYSKEELAEDLFLGDIVDFVKIEEFSQGRSGSAVFKAIPKFKGCPYKVTLVLKFGHIEEFLQELANFSRYVKWMIPYSWRVDILGEGISSKAGVIAYSLAFDGSANAEPLAAFAGRGDSSAVIEFVKQAFSSENRTWYAAIEDCDDGNLGPDLIARYFGEGDRFIELLGRLREILDEWEFFTGIYSGKRSTALTSFVERVRDLTLPDDSREKYQTCICHGDLHCGNVMVVEESRQNGDGSDGRRFDFAFIDFHDTGRAHIATDFVVFENSIRKDSDFRSNKAPVEYYKIEYENLRSLLGGIVVDASEKESDELTRISNIVRKSYVQNFPKSTLAHYVFHMFIFALFMLDNDALRNSERRDYMISFFCAVVDVLSDFGGSQNADAKRNT